MLGAFACARYRFVVEAITPLRLSAFAGATLRGGFGHVFKRTVCVWPPGDCPRCLLKNTCAYPYIFETAPPPKSEKLRGLDQVPRPFVIEAPHGSGADGPRAYGPGERFDFRLVLVGRGIDFLPYFVFTLCELGRVGLGAGRGQYRVVEVHTEGLDEGQCVYCAAEGVLHGAGERVTGEALAAQAAPVGRRLTVEFVTPTRIRSDGVVCTEVTFQDLVRALLRRLSSLCYFHCGAALAVDFKGLIEAAGRVTTAESRLRWWEQQRFSERQHQRIEMGGAVGTVTYEATQAQAWKPFLPLLVAGKWVHVGKGTVMGLGKYRLADTRPVSGERAEHA